MTRVRRRVCVAVMVGVVAFLVAFVSWFVHTEAFGDFSVPVTSRGTAAFRLSFDRPVTADDRRSVEAAGGRVVSVLPPSAILVEMSPAAVSRFLSSSEGRQGGGKIAALPLSVSGKLQEGLDLASSEPQSLTVAPLSGQDLASVERRIRELGGEVMARVGLKDGLPRLYVRLAGTSITELASVAEVRWIEHHAQRKLLNDVAVGERLMNVESVRTVHGLTGKGQVITTSDSGIDTGNLATMHEDLRTNVIGFGLADEDVCSQDTSGHGTHTAGSIVGTGAKSNGQFKGAAYEAKLWAWFCMDAKGGLHIPTDYGDVFRPGALGPTNAFIHSASWGSDDYTYTTESQSIDTWCWNHPDFLPVFSAGNEGHRETICTEAGAKNVLCVGATENLRPSFGSYADNPDEYTYFTSRGPMPDGRIKPDICAPGSYILSTRSSASSATDWGVYDTYYIYNGGTSMATPLTAGTMALIRQWLVEQCGFTNRVPSSALMKAIVTGGATRLGGRAPNSDYGWGRVNLAETLFPSNGLGVALHDYIPFGANSVSEFTVTVTNAAPLDVQLCWIDYPADPATAAERSLVIDLDLIVSNQTTGATWSPNDHTNNLESVRLEAADVATYSIFVRGTDTATYNSAQGGAAAVYVRGAISENSVDTNEYVTVTISAEGGAEQICAPSVGVHSYVKGSELVLSAGRYDEEFEEPGVDYRTSDEWGLDIERYPFVGWTATGMEEASGTNATIRLILTNDVSIVWRWTEKPSHVSLWLEAYDYYDDLWFSSIYIYWMSYGEPFDLTLEDSPLLTDGFTSDDAGETIRLDTALDVNNGYLSWTKSYGTLKYVAMYDADEDNDETFHYDENDHYRPVTTLQLPMTNFTLVGFCYAEESQKAGWTGLPYWWRTRHFKGAYDNGLVTDAERSATGDPDGDGFNNLAECNEETDPWSERSFPFRITDFSPSGLVFIGGLKGGFSVQHVEALGESWSNIWSAAENRTSVTNRLDLSSGTGPGFYRVIFEDR